jgi:hypothetical protein
MMMQINGRDIVIPPSSFAHPTPPASSPGGSGSAASPATKQQQQQPLPLSPPMERNSQVCVLLGFALAAFSDILIFSCRETSCLAWVEQ